MVFSDLSKVRKNHSCKAKVGAVSSALLSYLKGRVYGRIASQTRSLRGGVKNIVERFD